MERRCGVLVVSHGSNDRIWVKQIDEAVRNMNAHGKMPVETAFLELVEGRLIQDGIDRLEALGVTDIIAIPLFASSGSTHIDQIEFALGCKERPQRPSDLLPFRKTARTHFLSPMDDSPETVAILSESARRMSVQPVREMVLVVGHGSAESGFHARWRNILQSISSKLRDSCSFAASDYAMLLPDQLACKIKAWDRKRPDLRKIVVPFFLGEGYFTKTVIPARIFGLNCVYEGGALLPHALVTSWLDRRLAQFMSEQQHF